MDRLGFGTLVDSIIIPEGTPTEEIVKDVLPIREAILEMMPKSLFRFRSCDDMHIDAFEKDARPTLSSKPFERGALYPVVYSDERHDASMYITWQFMHVMGFQSKNPAITAFSKVALHKSRVW